MENSCRSQVSAACWCSRSPVASAAVTKPGPDAEALARCVEAVLGPASQIESVHRQGFAFASFLEQDLADRLAFFYAPLIIGGEDAVTAVAGRGIARIFGADKTHSTVNNSGEHNRFGRETDCLRRAHGRRWIGSAALRAFRQGNRDHFCYLY